MPYKTSLYLIMMSKYVHLQIQRFLQLHALKSFKLKNHGGFNDFTLLYLNNCKFELENNAKFLFARTHQSRDFLLLVNRLIFVSYTYIILSLLKCLGNTKLNVYKINITKVNIFQTNVFSKGNYHKMLFKI